MFAFLAFFFSVLLFHPISLAADAQENFSILVSVSLRNCFWMQGEQLEGEFKSFHYGMLRERKWNLNDYRGGIEELAAQSTRW